MGEVISIRVAQPSDLASIDAVLAESYPVLLKPDYPASILVTAIPLISRAQPRLLASGTYFVAESENEIVGAGGWTHSAPPGFSDKASVGHIRHVVTDHRHLRRGIARRLMGRVFETARAAGIRRMECLSTRTAVPFYASCGFVAGAEVDIALRPGISFPARFMERRL